MSQKPKLIILESADGCGKTTQCEMLAKHFNASILQQPNANNCVGFIRGLMKSCETINSDDRQYLAGFSHIVDAYTKFDRKSNLVMDRCYLSALVYGKLTKSSPEKLDIVLKTLKEVYSQNILGHYDVHIVFLTRHSRYDVADNDVFEKTTKWNDLRDEYNSLYDKMSKNEISFIGKENIYLLDVANNTIEEVHNTILKLVNGDKNV